MDDERSHLEETITRAFDVRPGGRLVVRADRGSISVEGVEADRVEIHVTCRIEADDPAKAREMRERCRFDFEPSGGEVRLRSRVVRRLFQWGTDDRRIGLHFRITVPRHFDVDVKTLAGALRVDGVEGEVRVRTAAGNVTVGDTTGNVRARTYAGSIHTGRVQGRVEASSWAGAIRVQEATGGIEARSKSGGVAAFVSGLSRGKNRVTSFAGNVEVRLAEGIGLDLDAGSRSGRVTLDVPVQGEPARPGARRNVQNSINGGGPRLVLRALAGNVRVTG